MQAPSLRPEDVSATSLSEYCFHLFCFFLIGTNDLSVPNGVLLPSCRPHLKTVQQL
jgi:hypothetical protein